MSHTQVGGSMRCCQIWLCKSPKTAPNVNLKFVFVRLQALCDVPVLSLPTD